MTVSEELEVIRTKRGGVLRAEDVVAYARNPKTALHGRFQWDDTEAAREYRLWQAREIINVEVTIIPHANVESRTYVSLLSDRTTDGGGYRTAVDVLSDKDMREEWLAQALDDLNLWRKKYRTLAKELAPVFEAMDVVRRPASKKVMKVLLAAKVS